MKIRFEKIEVINNVYCVIFTDGITRHKWDGIIGAVHQDLEDVINEILESIKIRFEKIELFNFNEKECYIILFCDGVNILSQSGFLKTNIEDVINEILEEYENT